MKKFSWNKFLNISMIVAVTIVLGAFLCLAYFYKPQKQVNADQLVEGVPFKAGIMQRTSSHMINNQFVYTGETTFWTGGLETVNDNDFVMLENYNAELILSGSTQNNERVENVFVSFGQPGTELYVITLNVTLTVNGETILIPRTIEEEHTAGILPNNNTTSRYWYAYFDGKDLQNTDNQTVSGTGLYNFTFEYSYAKDGQIYTGNQYSFSYYILDQSNYVDYPTFENTSTGNKDSKNVKQFYYNYTTKNLPYLRYDASKYNISYTKIKNKDSETVTSNFVVNVDPTTKAKTGKLTFSKTLSGITTTETIDNIENVNDTYFVDLYFDELGTYSITIKYLLNYGLSESPEFVVVDNLYPYNVKDNSYDIVDSNGNEIENPAQRGELKLHVFGIKAYFAKDGKTELKQKENNQVLVQADVTHLIPVGIDSSNITTGIKSQNTLNGETNPLKDFTNYPETNIVPINFDYYSTFSYDNNKPLSTYKVYSDSNFTNVIESGYITKDSNLDTAGYYEVVIKYTFNLYSAENLQTTGSEKEHFQVFLFRISNKPPVVTLYKTTEQTEENILKNNSYTNESVSVSWTEPTYFQAPIRATYTQLNFNGTTKKLEQSFNKGEVVGDGSNGHYYIKIYHSSSDDVYVEHSFTIDKDPISNYAIQPIYARKEANSNKIVGYGLADDENEVSFGTSKLINQPFTLTYPQKESGAQITTRYYKIPFSSNINAGTKQTVNGETYINTYYQIDPANMVDCGTYSLDYTSIASGIVSSNNAFIDSKSFIYYFEMSDAAGNTASTYIIYDLTKPYIIIDADASTEKIDSIDNPYGIVTKEASITWGNYKSIKVDATLINDKVENTYLQKVIDSETALFKNINGSYYLCVPITSAKFTQGTTSRTISSSSVTIYPTSNDSDSDLKKFFSGDDKIYSYQISDASNISSLTNLAQSNIVKGFVRMFLDNAQGIAYGNFSTSLDNNTFNNYEDLLPGTSSSKQLRFTYIPGTPSSGYYVKEVSYTFYDFASDEYITIDNENGYYESYQQNIVNGVPTPTYPFSKQPTVTNKVLSASSFTKRKGSGSSEEQDCVVTEILNPVSENGSIVTKPGMYVIKRVYEQKDDTNYSLDGLVRYYTYYVDRNGIISIDTSTTDCNIYQDSRSEMLYQTGSGILFNFSNQNISGNYDTYYTALQIQQFINVNTSSESSEIFESNKLPINFYIPIDKYNSRFVLNKADNSSSYSSYISSVSTLNNTNFALRVKIEHSTLSSDNSGLKTTIVYDNTNGNITYNKSFFTAPDVFIGYNGLRLTKEGVYTVYFYDNSDNRTSQMTDSQTTIDKQNNNSYKFIFKITHSAPSGEYLSKYNDQNRTDKLFVSESNDGTFKSFNDDSLRFRFRKSDDQYKADVDPTKVVVTKQVGSSATTTIFNSANGFGDILTFVPDSVDANGAESSTGYYVLTIFDEYEYQNEGKTYLGGSGSSRDYLLSKSQNIKYNISLQYYGFESDYITDEGINYFQRNFTIILDRIKPQYNYQTLIDLDNQKYAANSVLSSSQLDSYFYTVNQDFEFIQNPQYGSELDSDILYVRRLTGRSATCDYPDYYKTFTPDDENYYSDGYTNHIRFSESNVGAGSEGNNFTDHEYSNNKLSASEVFDQGKGYYEIVECDEAGNYRVYAVYYNPESESNVIHYNYTPALSTDDNSGVISYNEENQTYFTDEILGTNLNFTTIEDLGINNNDYFYKCIIKYGSTTKTIINNPNDRNDSNNWTDFLKQINAELEFTNVVSDDGYRVTITFVNRLSKNYEITYRVPGDRLEPIFTDVTTSQFTITIPADNDSTYIKEFHVWKFTNGGWIEQSQDSLGKTIVKSYANGSSLQNNTYTFGLGEFKFQLIDIFERGRDQDEYPPYYKGMGVNDVRNITYGTYVENKDVAHTANNVSLSYQTNLYLLSIYQLDNTSNNYVLIAEEDFAKYSIIEQSITNGVRTLIFQNNIKDTIKQFKVVLVVEKTKTEYVYEFAINKLLPEIVLRNHSGGKLISSYLENEPTIHTENFYVTWDTNYVFTSTVNLTRTYVDSSGRQQVEVIKNISNGYEVNLAGTYTASISNNLNHTDSSHNIYFKLVSGEIVIYDVVQINNGIETILRPSPKTGTIEVNGTTKILYSYYTLSTYNKPTGSDMYIELRANKNKGIEYELISSTAEEETVAENDETAQPNKVLKKKIYKIYGASNYGYERYIQIIFVDPTLNDENLSLTGLTAYYPTDAIGTMAQLQLSSELKTNVEYINLSWKAYNKTNLNYDDLRGNLVYLDYYFNGNFIRTIYSDSNDINTLTISTAGIHKFKFYDLAGNVQSFASSSEMVINLINNVLFTINNDEPINNQIFNTDVILEITNRDLYFSDPTISATLNGVSITPNRVGTSFYQYKFSEHGYYELTISTQITQNESVTTKYCFTIINPNIALPCFSVPQNANFTVVKVLKENADITHTLDSLNELWISTATLGSGNYTITLKQFSSTLNTDVEFGFQIWINNETPYLYSTTPFGSSSTKEITITFNPKIIYDQIGESYISISGEPNINISSESANEITTYKLTNNREYYIRIYSADGKLVNSYKVTKDEPLNTTSIIIIVVVSIVVIALIVVFIVIRRHLKFR